MATKRGKPDPVLSMIVARAGDVVYNILGKHYRVFAIELGASGKEEYTSLQYAHIIVSDGEIEIMEVKDFLDVTWLQAYADRKAESEAVYYPSLEA